jgi:hypothetical protein
VEEGWHRMKTNIKKIYTAYCLFLFATHICSFIFLSFILDVICTLEKKEKKFPGIDIKEFR